MTPQGAWGHRVSDTSLDLDRRAWSRVLGQITIIGTWLRGEDDAWRPCLVIVRTGEEFDATPCVVPLDLAYVWDDRSGKGDPMAAARTAMSFVSALRLDDGSPMRVARKIAEAIADHLDELIAMPPAPPREGPTLVEATITVRETGERYEAVIRG
ncbi:hypothetical protein [Microcystis phage Mwe-JY25]